MPQVGAHLEAPHTRKPMADDEDEDDALDNLEVGVVDDELRLPALEDARGAKDPNELDEPQCSQRAPRAPKAQCSVLQSQPFLLQK